MIAGMNDYQLYEAGNMQPDDDPFSMSLTPRIELKLNGSVYRNISDLDAAIAVKTERDQIVVTTHSKLVDKDQQSPLSGPINCTVVYCFTDKNVIMKFSYDKNIHAEQIKIIFPVIAKHNERIGTISNRELRIDKTPSVVKISANHPITQMPSTNGRIFNFVPGYEAIPFCIVQNNAVIEIGIV